MPTKRVRSKSGSAEELGWEQLDDKDGLGSKEVIEEPESDCYTAEKLASKRSPKSTSSLVTPKRKIPKNSPPLSSQLKSRGRKRFRKLRRALSFSRSRSKSLVEEVNAVPKVSNLNDGNVESSKKPAPLIALPGPTLQGKKETLPRSPHISPHPEARSSGRSAARRKLDLLSKEIEELESKFRKPGPQVSIGYICVHTPPCLLGWSLFLAPKS